MATKYGFSIYQDLALALCVKEFGACPYGCAKDGAPHCDGHVRAIPPFQDQQCKPGKLIYLRAIKAGQIEECRRAEAYLMQRGEQ